MRACAELLMLKTMEHRIRIHNSPEYTADPRLEDYRPQS